ncbi:ester cyclase [Maribacter ulvicola]|uniref:SnoaL-like polyketide cyclase n=1 Tax=Maribacter ulvicola TaxID=228959 RepID=A0A1N6ZDX7_9FLAO|nr:ester cyclase [Maribacter ulvicola]SIR24999.1 SnoaL-like polyketide cyclase [Maribacter ulvicola]
MKYFSINVFIIVVSLLISCRDNGHAKKTKKSNSFQHNSTTLKQNSKDYLIAWSENDTLLIRASTTQNFIRNVNGKNVSYNQQDLLEAMHLWHRAMPDIILIDKEINVFDNRSYVNWECTGTNTGMFGKTPPTGKVGHTKGISILTFNDDGKIIHESSYFDMLSFMEDLGYTLSIPVMN